MRRRAFSLGPVPEALWAKAECVVVIPSMKKAAFVVGGQTGSGVMSCRRLNAWSAPVSMHLAKGSFGLQIGAERVDLVLLVMQDQLAVSFDIVQEHAQPLDAPHSNGLLHTRRRLCCAGLCRLGIRAACSDQENETAGRHDSEDNSDRRAEKDPSSDPATA